MSARIRFAQAPSSEIPLPPVGKASVFLDAADGRLKIKKNNGAIIELENFEENIQDIIGETFTDSDEINFIYDDDNNVYYLQLFETTVTAGSYGAADSVATFTVDTKGRLTAAATVLISIVSSQVTNFTSTVRSTLLTGLNLALTGTIAATDTVLEAFGKLQNQVTSIFNRNINTGTGLQGGGNLTADRTISIANTGVVNGSYGTATKVSTINVNPQGQITSASETTIAIPSSQVTNFTEAAQDAVGSILTDTPSIDFTYNDAGNTISAAVLPAGVAAGGDVSGNLNALTVDKLKNKSIVAGSLKGQIMVYNGTSWENVNVGTNGQYLKADSTQSSGVIWSDPSLPTPLNSSSNTLISTTSNTMQNVFTLTPAAGNYYVVFNADMEVTNDGAGEIDIAIDGTESFHSNRRFFAEAAGLLGAIANGRGSQHTFAYLTVNGSQQIQMRYRSITNSVSLRNRGYIIFKVG